MSGPRTDNLWPDERIQRLRADWDEGHSTAEIGRRLGVSKNAVVGKAHRLDLPIRPSPIKRDGTDGYVAKRRRLPPRITGPTLPPLSSFSPSPSASVSPPRPRAPQAPRVVPAVVPFVPASPPVVVEDRKWAWKCSWPLGDPGSKDFRYCEDGVVVVNGRRSPYCAEHHKKGFVRVRDRREGVAA